MAAPPTNRPRLRKDLLLRRVKRNGDALCELKLQSAKSACIVKEPEFELARRMNGQRDLEQLVSESAELGIPMTREAMAKFVGHLTAHGLLEQAVADPAQSLPDERTREVAAPTPELLLALSQRTAFDVVAEEGMPAAKPGPFDMENTIAGDPGKMFLLIHRERLRTKWRNRALAVGGAVLSLAIVAILAWPNKKNTETNATEAPPSEPVVTLPSPAPAPPPENPELVALRAKIESQRAEVAKAEQRLYALKMAKKRASAKQVRAAQVKLANAQKTLNRHLTELQRVELQPQHASAE
jgi:hypothetical protein